MAYVTVDVDMSEFDDDEIMDEAISRGLVSEHWIKHGDEMNDLIQAIWLKRRQKQDYEAELERYMWLVTGKVI